jgi:methionine sulfoxide reductase heme-binding subunit
MSVSYQAVLWNRQKKIYDFIIAGFAGIYFIIFASFNLIFYPEITGETLIIRATSTLAAVLLHLILAIGPLTRINSKFLPLLYNRRHLGVTMFCMGAIHGVFSILQFHSLGNINPIASLFLSNLHYNSFTQFPFEVLGFFALIIFFLMAITSHDFWLHNLTPRFWKSLHMFVYLAYGLIVMHVMLGVIQLEASPFYFFLVLAGSMTIATLHLIAAIKENRKDALAKKINKEGFVEVCNLGDIKEKRAKVVCVDKERIAIFKYDGKLSAVSNVCKHQNGPLGEGKIVDGCITCPWHGYQYLPQNGQSPPPFKEKVSTYDVKLIGEKVFVNPSPYPEGTERPPVHIPEKTSAEVKMNV